MPTTTNASVRLAVLGVGAMGSVHARSVAEGRVPGMELAAVCDLESSRCDVFPGCAHHLRAEDLFASGEIDAVLIATPHEAHTDVGIAALGAGLHVLVEKPISVHVGDARRLIAAHTDERQVFAAMFNQRTDPRYIHLRSLIRSGELGRIHRVQWTITDWFRTQHYYDSGDWRATWAGEGGGVLINQCMHQLDLWQWLFGMPQRIRGTCRFGRFHDVEVEDDVTATLEYPDGMTGVLVTTTGETPGVNRLEIAADGGLITVEGDEVRWTRNAAPASAWIRSADNAYSRPSTERADRSFPDHGEQHVGILKNFAAAILHGDPPIAAAAEGVRSLELANAILLSAFEDRAVELPIDADLYLRHLNARRATSRYRPPIGTAAK